MKTDAAKADGIERRRRPEAVLMMRGAMGAKLSGW